jgi:hypothetical protein
MARDASSEVLEVPDEFAHPSAIHVRPAHEKWLQKYASRGDAPDRLPVRAALGKSQPQRIDCHRQSSTVSSPIALV